MEKGVLPAGAGADRSRVGCSAVCMVSVRKQCYWLAEGGRPATKKKGCERARVSIEYRFTDGGVVASDGLELSEHMRQ